MFTGLIEEIGIVEQVIEGAQSARITVKAAMVLKGLAIGDSISTNGICLTVTAFNPQCFTVDVMPETMRSSNFNGLKSGHLVNLERALRVGDRFGGHMVTGHIDGVGVIRRIQEEGNATWVEVALSKEHLKYVIHKGSVAIDGTSLTVSRLSSDSLSVSIIPHTKDVTTLLSKKIGDSVNIECDVIGKYVERLLGLKEVDHPRQSVSLDFLKTNGFA